MEVTVFDAALPRLVLYCPRCGVNHVDEGVWATRPHRTHLCANCGHEWDEGGLCFGISEDWLR